MSAISLHQTTWAEDAEVGTTDEDEVFIKIGDARMYVPVDTAQKLSNDLQDAVDKLAGMGQS